ncbi:hypothetical protein HU200_036493 [Digitaria exilis]|uniref:Uncharacterized protein n=1 Tax=Digitaria exilis TaxID=1010633 RepID=A0A835ENN4_9POAL|nr:hypothetical protein HU200_036493 [Digitaria exilis]CAB3477570.1 unnamed protein product [Digitaria exilis]
MAPPSPPSTATTTAAADVIRESSAAPSPLRGGVATTPPPRPLKASSPLPPAPAAPPTAIDKTLASVANLAKLLPTGTALAFNSLSPSFTNHGACLSSNRYLTAALLYLCFLSCVFFSFTDSFVGADGKLYYGLATAKGFLVFNYTGDTGDDAEEDAERRGQVFGDDLDRLRIRCVDYAHAALSAAVFVTVALSDAGVQSCYFPNATGNMKQVLTNLPLGAGFLSSMVFLVFPTTRKGFDYTGRSTNA